MDKLMPGFAGTSLVRFMVSDAKGFTNDAVMYAEQIVAALPQDKRISWVCEKLAYYYVSMGRKKEAEALALQAMKWWPELPEWHEFFKATFGYVPSDVEQHK